LTTIVNRTVLAFVGAALGIVSVMMLRTVAGPAVTADLRLYELLGLLGLVTGAVLLMRVVLEVLESEP
jgi:ubiquinone biosynthesis protein